MQNTKQTGRIVRVCVCKLRDFVRCNWGSLKTWVSFAKEPYKRDLLCVCVCVDYATLLDTIELFI